MPGRKSEIESIEDILRQESAIIRRILDEINETEELDAAGMRHAKAGGAAHSKATPHSKSNPHGKSK